MLPERNWKSSFLDEAFFTSSNKLSSSLTSIAEFGTYFESSSSLAANPWRTKPFSGIDMARTSSIGLSIELGTVEFARQRSHVLALLVATNWNTMSTVAFVRLMTLRRTHPTANEDVCYKTCLITG